MDKLTQIEAFVAAIEHGSLARAAVAAHVTPVMIGRRIDALEQRLGVKLLHRSTRRLALTEQGAVFLEDCRRVVGELDRAESMLAESRNRASGHLRVSAPAGFGRMHVAPHAPSFIARNPDVRVSFNLTDQVVDLVQQGFDLGIRIGGVIDPNFVAVKLASNRRVVCVSPAYLSEHGTPRTLDDLQHHNCLAFSLQGGQQGGWNFRCDGKEVTVRVRGNLECNDGELLHRWARDGIGLAWRSTWEIQGELARGELVTVLDEFALESYDIMAVWPHQRHLPAKVRFFVDHLKRVWATPDYWMRAS